MVSRRSAVTIAGAQCLDKFAILRHSRVDLVTMVEVAADRSRPAFAASPEGNVAEIVPPAAAAFAEHESFSRGI